MFFQKESLQLGLSDLFLTNSCAFNKNINIYFILLIHFWEIMPIPLITYLPKKNYLLISVDLLQFKVQQQASAIFSSVGNLRGQY